MSHKNADNHIHVNIEFGEGDGKIPVDKIAQKAEDYRPSETVTYKMIPIKPLTYLDNPTLI